MTGLETVTAAQKLKDEAAARKIIEATGDNDKGKQTFKSTAENMNQDKWLALAQAGLTLMSTGDFGKAGSAGLAALRESKKSDLAERKIAADERLTARIAAANKKTSSIKAPPCRYANLCTKPKLKKCTGRSYTGNFRQEQISYAYCSN